MPASSAEPAEGRPACWGAQGGLRGLGWGGVGGSLKIRDLGWWGGGVLEHFFFGGGLVRGLGGGGGGWQTFCPCFEQGGGAEVIILIG